MDPALIDVLSKLGFAGLCIWLIYDTRLEARKREDRMSRALDRSNRRSVRALNRNAVAMNRLAVALESKPCLVPAEIKDAADEFAQSTEQQKAS